MALRQGKRGIDETATIRSTLDRFGADEITFDAVLATMSSITMECTQPAGDWGEVYQCAEKLPGDNSPDRVDTANLSGIITDAQREPIFAAVRRPGG